MNNCILTLVIAAAAVALRTSASPTTHPLQVNNVNHYVAYDEQDANSAVDTDSDPDAEGDYDVFYDHLSPDGRWFYDDDYGYVWQPTVAVSATDWRPYSDGHWVWTDRGWFWESNEDFGWATYHYGRWAMIEGVGWVWVPGSRWAPAWVSWRHTDDDDCVGWAPLPPESTFDVSVGFHSWCDSYYDIGPAAYLFIRIGDFCRPSYREFYVPQQQNVVLINRTTNITNITYNNNVINNYGPRYETVSQLVQQRVGQTVPNYKINYAAQRAANATFKTSVKGNQLNVVAPPQRLKAVSTVTPKVAKQLGKAQVNRGWQNVPQAQAQQLREKFAQQTPLPKTLPSKPVLPAKPQIQAATKGQQQPATEAGKVKQEAGTPLKPFTETPKSKTTEERNKQLETEKANTAEKGKPGETAKKPAAVTEEKKAGAEAAAAKEKPKVNEAEKAKVEHAQGSAKPAVHEEASKRRKEETKKEPSGTPQAKANRSNLPPHESHHQVRVAEANVTQPHGSQPHAEAHVSQPHGSQPHPQPHPKPPPPQPHRAAPSGNQKKKEEQKG
jgi:hypothetical protein